MKKIILLLCFLSIIIGTERCAKSHPVIEPEDDGNPYRENIIGQWKLLYVTSSLDSVNNVHISSDSINYSASTVIYDFRPANKLLITGYVEDDLLPGEHYYEYKQNLVCPLCLPVPNLQIDDGDWLYCTGMKDSQTMTISGQTKIGWIITDYEVVISGCTKSWVKHFIKLN
jgi:hypothetical protein